MRLRLYNLYMDSKQGNEMNEEVKSAALELATKMVAYQQMKAHCKASELHEDKVALSYAYDALFDAQNNLYFAVESTTKPL